MPDFPNELVEAVCTVVLKHRQHERIQPVEAEAILAAVLPLIEQRVIDRLAREAGDDPADRLPHPFTLNHAIGEKRPVVFHESAVRAVRMAAACGVAAERARGDDVDGWRVFCHNGEDSSKSVAHILAPGDSVTFHECEAIHVRFDPIAPAALSPERTTGEGE